MTCTDTIRYKHCNPSSISSSGALYLQTLLLLSLTKGGAPDGWKRLSYFGCTEVVQLDLPPFTCKVCSVGECAYPIGGQLYL